MPPKAKFTKEQITEAAFEIVREKGFECLTARALGEKLGSSSCPIFTTFENMDEVRKSAVRAAKELYSKYIAKGLEDKPAFKGVGMQYIQFAICEPMLFKLLFMSGVEKTPSQADILLMIEENYDRILESIKRDYGLNSEEAKKIHRYMWIYAHGIAALFVTKMCTFSEDDISGMMTDVFISLLKKIKSDSNH